MTRPALSLADFIEPAAASPLAPWLDKEPWEITGESGAIVRRLLATLPGAEYRIDAEVAVHVTATVESGCVLKGPLILGPHCFVAAGAYLRGGNWVDRACTLGPGSELKSSFVFAGSTLAHFNFVGDSILGSGVNLEAGSIVCNHRNERADTQVLVRLPGGLHRTGCDKFGAVVGDRCRIGANAVIAPGALLARGTVVPRGHVHDDETIASGGQA